jgi:hypothetical protein
MNCEISLPDVGVYDGAEQPAEQAGGENVDPAERDTERGERKADQAEDDKKQ